MTSAVNTLAPFWISVCGIEELAGHCEVGVSHVLSILDPDWPVPEAFGAFGEHAKLELRFHDVIDVQGAGTVAPQPEHVTEILSFGRRLSAPPGQDAHLLVHCHAGVSRSTAAMTLILAQALPEVSANRIFGEVLGIRPQAWPNLRILELGDAMLGRQGELVAVAAGVYRRQLDERQHLVEQMRSGGRGREITVALGYVNEGRAL
jgi:predicted protein tyrosine phosphatase